MSLENRQRVIEEEYLVAVRAEEEEPAQLGVDVVSSDFHAVRTCLERKVIAELILSDLGLLRHVDIGSRRYGREREVRVVCDSKNLIQEILEVEREHIHFRRADRVRVVDDKAVQAIVVRIAARQISRQSRINLIVRGIVLLKSVAVKH